jgi:Recombination directionality factor-like
VSTNRRRDSAGSRARDVSPLADSRIRHALRDEESPVLGIDAGDDAEPVGRFQYATLLRNRFQVATSWQVSSGNCEVLARVAHILGRAPHDISAEICSLPTETTTVEIILEGPDALRLRWCRDGLHSCDGKVQCNDGMQRSCTCPPSLPERRKVTRHGHGCEPRVEVFFQLAQDPALGTFTFASGSWYFAKQVINAHKVLQANGQPARARLSLRRTDQRLYSGRTITYTRPVLTLVGNLSRQPDRAAHALAGHDLPAAGQHPWVAATSR